jgi:hypothetical protein
MSNLVIRLQKEPRTYFGDLAVGSVFRLVKGDNIWMKIQPVQYGIDVLHNALYLSDSKCTLLLIDDEEEVECLRSELIIYSNK